MPDPLYIDERTAADLLGLPEAIDTLADVHRRYAYGDASNMVKTQVQVGPANLHAVGGAIPGQDVAGTKTWMHTPGGAQPLLVLSTPATGRCSRSSRHSLSGSAGPGRPRHSPRGSSPAPMRADSCWWARASRRRPARSRNAPLAPVVSGDCEEAD